MKHFWLRFANNRGAVVGLVIVLAVIVVALLAGLFYPQSPWTSVADPMLDPFSDKSYPFGTDMLGRDIAAGLAYGARIMPVRVLDSAGEGEAGRCSRTSSVSPY